MTPFSTSIYLVESDDEVDWITESPSHSKATIGAPTPTYDIFLFMYLMLSEYMELCGTKGLSAYNVVTATSHTKRFHHVLMEAWVRYHGWFSVQKRDQMRTKIT